MHAFAFSPPTSSSAYSSLSSPLYGNTSWEDLYRSPNGWIQRMLFNIQVSWSHGSSGPADKTFPFLCLLGGIVCCSSSHLPGSLTSVFLSHILLYLTLKCQSSSGCHSRSSLSLHSPWATMSISAKSPWSLQYNFTNTSCECISFRRRRWAFHQGDLGLEQRYYVELQESKPQGISRNSIVSNGSSRSWQWEFETIIPRYQELGIQLAHYFILFILVDA